ncbi:PREDICTED: insulin-like growth factor-binding protein complex acid labile subunit [Nicrophorus vespilloides]|uniref:Insulin-like growth factor-binding protein complex acid labile subunit n=1 Tax=Nicrophorus vespilloides TaxID=110193 RepID=A0ABM1M998_NICVS|nr:PREDICTED: insulin-like growth factor-binding protein complex acid labile subunit [Nicrophorus vespilloides]
MMMMLLVLQSLLIMVSTVRAGDYCPEVCVCRNEAAACRTAGGNLTDFRLPEGTESLELSGDVGDDLLDLLDEMAQWPDLVYLTLNEVSDLPDLSNYSMCGPDSLRSLVIAGCRVDSLPRQFNLSGLLTLQVVDDGLRVIGSEQFRTLETLEMLNLSANAIAVIEGDAFVGLNSLRNLDLSQNKLSELADTVLIPLNTLQYLNLSNNRLEVLNEACFSSLVYLQQLDVSWNRLSKVAPGTLELPSLARLLLAGNPKLGGGSREPVLFVGTGRRLQTVDASRIGLKQVPAALTHSIRTLRLAGNSIPSVSCGDLDSYPLLQLLDFTANELADIEEDALGRLESLTVLYLADNKLRAIPHSLPEKLQVLHLERNQIESIKTIDLQGLSHLSTLLLPGNKISSIMETAFSQLSSLSSLDLSRNPITKLPTGILAGPTQLRVLRLAGLNVVSPAKELEFPLPTPEHLITLDLSKSPGLARQMLADTAALAASRELQELNIADSDLIYVRSDLLHFLPQLRMVHLHDNPLNCSGLEWLAEWMRKQDEPEYRRVSCASPADLRGTLLVDLQSIEPETTTIHHETTRDAVDVNINVTAATVAVVPLQGGNKGADNNLPDNKVATTKEPMNTLREAEKANESNLFMENWKRGNVTEATAEMSMYNGSDSKNALAHPSMLILVAGVLLAAAILIVFTARITYRKHRLTHDEDIEVSSLPSVTELW